MLFNWVKKIVVRTLALRNSPLVREFIKHNKKVFLKSTRATKTGPVVLFELNAMQSAHVAYSYLANVLADNAQARIDAYAQRAHKSYFQKFIFKVKKFINFNEFGVFRSFGVCSFIEVELSQTQEMKAKRLFADVFKRLNSKQDIEALKINQVWVGDLIYDSFLMTYKKPTIDKNSPEFKRSLMESIRFFVFWEEYFDKNDVCAINVSHCVYNLAIPLRIALQRDIPAFQSNVTHLYRLSKKNLFAYNDFVQFREIFSALSHEVRSAGVKEARRRIERRFAGEIGVDMSYSTKSAYGSFASKRLLKESPRKKILVATHCFFDSPHSYGNNLFPDFYEWLDFLGNITVDSNCDWYIKTHPDFLAGTKDVIDFFIQKYPKFSLLPADASHHQIIAEGIDFALTVYGTIAFEYAALGIPVINASLNNPHIAYEFNVHPKNIEEYRDILLNLDKLSFSINKQHVYEYYFMRHIFNTEDMFFKNYNAMIDQLGGYSKQFAPQVYGKWLNEWNEGRHRTILSALQLFIQSGDFRMDYSHYGQEFNVELIEVTV
jgi:hypothetical protein